MESLLDKDDNVITDGKEINNTIVRFFAGWFCRPESYAELGKLTDDDWRHGFGSKEEFMTKFKELGIAEQALHYLWLGFNKMFAGAGGEGDMNNPAADSKFQRLHELILDITADKNTPTFAEFQQTIRSCPEHSAGGPSGLTYAMLKACPEHALMKLYDNLACMWKAREIPEWWKCRFLAPMPKTDDESPALKDLRPLMLVEVTRKLWTRLVVRKIRKVWDDNKAFDEAQGGFVPRSGTDTVILQLTNALEETIECATQINLASFDKKRAFDSVTKGHITLAWHRMGVPIELAQFLRNLDEDGQTMVKSPIAQKTWKEKGSKGFRDSSLAADVDVMMFNPQRGVGQGDVHSPYSWIALYDILLASLAAAQDDPNWDFCSSRLILLARLL